MRDKTVRRWLAVIAVLAAIAAGIFLGGSAYAGSAFHTEEHDWSSPVFHNMVP